MNNSPSRAIRLLAIAFGVSILSGLGLTCLSFLFFDRNPLLTISAFMILMGTLLNLILLWMLHQDVRVQSIRFRQLILTTGVVGSPIALIGATNDFVNAVAGYDLIIWFPLSQSIIVTGYGFVGIWLLLLNSHAQIHDLWSHRLAWLGIITGMIMAVGLLATPRVFIPSVSLNHEPVPEIGELIGYVGWMLIYPIWSIWFGRVAIKGQHEDPQVRSLA